MSEPLVSIVIPSFNYAGFLPRAVDSALAQTYANTQVVVVDDGSTDDSRDVLASYGARIEAVLKPNGGLTSAINAGFAASRGEVVCWLDADDELLPTKVEAVVRAFGEHPDAALVYHRLQTVDAAGAELDAPWPDDVWTGSIATRVARAGGWWPRPTTSAMSFPRWVLARLHPMPESSVPGQATWPDAYAGDVAPFLGPVVGLPEALTRYRVHGQNSSGSFARAEMSFRQYRFERAQLETALAELGCPVRLAAPGHHLACADTAHAAGWITRRRLAGVIARNPLVRPRTKARRLTKLALGRVRGAERS